MGGEVGGARRSDGGEAGGGDPRQDAEGGTHGPPREAEGVLDRTHELDVEGVAPVARDDVREDRAAEEREIADEIEDLVPDELVAVAQAVERPALREHDRVVERAAAREPVLPHDSQVLEKPVGARRRSEEHTSELQSQSNLVCRLLLEKKKHSAVCLRMTPMLCPRL